MERLRTAWGWISAAFTLRDLVLTALTVPTLIGAAAGVATALLASPLLGALALVLVWAVGELVLAAVWFKRRSRPEGTPRVSTRTARAGRARGWLDHYVEGLAEINSYSRTLQGITKDTRWITDRMDKHSRSIGRAAGRPELVRRHTSAIGDDLHKYARKMEQHNLDLVNASEGPKTLSAYLETQTSGNFSDDELDSLYETSNGVLSAIRFMRERTSEARNAILTIRAQNVSADLNEGIDDVDTVVSDLVDISKRTEANLQFLLRVIAKRREVI